MSEGATAGLTAKQRQFVDEYLIDLNATQAAIRAGYSRRTARAAGQRLLTHVDISAAIAGAMAVRSERTKITQDQVLQELVILLRSDVRHFEIDDTTGSLILAEDAPDSAWRAVSSVKHRRIVTGRGEDKETTYEVEFRLWDKTAAVRMAGQHLAMFTEKHEVSLPAGAGVLAVPVPVSDAQWAGAAIAQQAALAQKPGHASHETEQ